MDISILIAFAAGFVTVASPCVLPLLPVILASSARSGRLRPWGVLTGFVLTFSAVTLALASVVNALGISPRDLIAILQAIKASGALQAEIEVL